MGRGGVNLPTGSDGLEDQRLIKKDWRLRRKRIGKKKSSEDQTDGGRSTRRPGGSAGYKEN